MKYKTVWCEGYWAYEPDRIFSVNIALDSWDGVEDAEDEGIFHYMDGEPLELGTNLADGFVITGMETENA
jgi:hypothetical protein